jgi:IclR family transcriptional regulator, KDG regulon repressor
MKRDIRSEIAQTSLDRAMAILELASQRPGGLTNAEVHRRLGVATSSCSYVLRRLEDAGYLRRSPATRRYELGLKVLTLAHRALRDIGFRAIAEPVLHGLAKQTGFSGYIGVLQRGAIVIVARIDQPELAEIDFEIGVILPVHATAVGKLLLAHLKPNERRTILATSQLTKKSKNTIDSRERLIQDLDVIRRRGYSTSDGELYPGIRAIAAPISDAAGTVCAGLTLVGRNVALDDPEAIHTVKSASALISRRLTDAALSRRFMEEEDHTFSTIQRL